MVQLNNEHLEIHPFFIRFCRLSKLVRQNLDLFFISIFEPLQVSVISNKSLNSGSAFSHCVDLIKRR